MSTFPKVKTVEELAGELNSSEKSPEEQVAELEDPRLKEQWTFQFSYKDRRGREWKGEFTNQILSIDDVNRVGTIRAMACGNVPIDALDFNTVQNAERLAHCSVSLVKRPSWAEKIGALKDPQVLNALYQEVASHESIFHGYGEDQEAGVGGAGDGQGQA